MPTERQIARSVAGYEPRQYGAAPRQGSRIIDLIMARGDQQAEAARVSGDIWGNAIQNIGQTIAGGLQAHGEQKAVKKRDAAWASYVEQGTWASNPTEAYQTALKIGGPDLAQKWVAGLAGASQLMQEKRDPKADTEGMVAMYDAMETVDEPTRARQWGPAAKIMRSRYPDLPFSDEYSPDQWTLAGKLVGQVRPQAKREKVELRNADGSVSTKFVDPSVPGEYVSAPEPPKPANLELKETGAGFQAFDPQAGTLGPVIGRPKPGAPRAAPSRFWVMRDGSPVRVSEAEYRPGDLPASTREQGRPVTSGDANRMAEFDTAVQDMANLKKRTSGNRSTGIAAKAGTLVPDFVTEWTGIGADAKGQQALIDLQKQTIGKTLEGGVLRKEDETKYDKILLRIGDPPDVASVKLANMEDQIARKRENLLSSLEDAGYETSKYRSRQGAAPAPAARAGSQPTAGSARPRVANDKGEMLEWDGSAWVPVR